MAEMLNRSVTLIRPASGPYVIETKYRLEFKPEERAVDAFYREYVALVRRHLHIDKKSFIVALVERKVRPSELGMPEGPSAFGVDRAERLELSGRQVEWLGSPPDPLEAYFINFPLLPSHYHGIDAVVVQGSGQARVAPVESVPTDHDQFIRLDPGVFSELVHERSMTDDFSKK